MDLAYVRASSGVGNTSTDTSAALPAQHHCNGMGTRIPNLLLP